MKNINTYTVVGRLARDIELYYTNSGYAIGKFGLAYSRSVKKGDTWEDKSCFIDCVMFGKRAEGLQPWLKKGTEVTILGELDHETWENQEGQKRSKHSVLVNEINLHGGAKKQESKEMFSGPTPNENPAPQGTGSENDIPF